MEWLRSGALDCGGIAAMDAVQPWNRQSTKKACVLFATLLTRLAGSRPIMWDRERIPPVDCNRRVGMVTTPAMSPVSVAHGPRPKLPLIVIYESAW